MGQAAIGQLEQQIDDEVNKRFPGAVQRVAVLQYGADPVIEPGELLVRVILQAGRDTRRSGRRCRSSRPRTARRSRSSGAICPTSCPKPGEWNSVPATTPTARGWCWAAGPATRSRPGRKAAS